MSDRAQEISLSTLVNPTPRQRDFLDALKRHRYVLYGGAAGGGKSYILRWTLVALLLKWAAAGHKGVRVGMFCEDYPALRERQLSKIKYEFPSWLGKLRENVHEFELAPQYGSGVIAFRNLDDPSKYLSAEFAAIAVDELTRNEMDVFNVLRMRLRWPGIDDTKFLAATNPGGVGHVWVKTLWVDRDFRSDIGADLRPLAHQFAFVQAKASDNPHLPSSYSEALASLPEKMRRAYQDGDWDIFEGQYYTEFRRDVHVIKPFEIPPSWRRFCSLDYGLDCTACYWWAVAPNGQEYIYRELYRSNLTLSKAARYILDMTPEHECIEYTVASPDLWNRRQDTGYSGAEILSKSGLRNLVRADNRRIPGWRALRERLLPYEDEHGVLTAQLRIFSVCKDLIRTLPALVHDDTDPEDVHAKCEDHGPESIRYGVMSRPHPNKPPEEPKPFPTIEEQVNQYFEELTSGNLRSSQYVW
jgi:phage terminase large subunit